MNNRERLKAILNYESYDRLPVLHFGFWTETLGKWASEGHLGADEIRGVDDGNDKENAISRRLGFDFNYYTTFTDRSGFSSLFPAFETIVLEEFADGSYHYRNEDGVIELRKKGVVSIPGEIGHSLVDRASWESLYLPRLQFSEDRFDEGILRRLAGGSKDRTEPLGLYCKSLFGQIRSWMGVEGISYLQYDDEALYREMIDTVGELSFQIVQRLLASGIEFDFAHYWEDICFKNGPLVSPEVFAKLVGPHYRRINDLLNSHGITTISLDCDGCIDKLIPVWLENGVNTMFPIEVGTWGGSIGPWRGSYGRRIRGVGGMDKRVLALDYAAIDLEIERLKALVDLGGFIPCPDHRLPIDAEWDNVSYYCDRMRKVFG
jgi:uroporphyrinogen decarboxylase